MTLTPQSLASVDLFASAIPGLAERLARYRVTEGAPDPELFGVFVVCLDETVPALEAALACGDFAAMARHAHALKGMGGAAGAAEISVLGECMEVAAQTGQEGTVRQLAQLLQLWRQAIG